MRLVRSLQFAGCILPLTLVAPIVAQTIPNAMTECEGDLCQRGVKATWLFVGRNGTARWPTGAIANLTVQRYDAESVIIHRTDTEQSSSPGLTAVYQGTIQGNRIDGTVTWTWPGHFKSASPSGTWHAIVNDKSPPPDTTSAQRPTAEAVPIAPLAVSTDRREEPGSTPPFRIHECETATRSSCPSGHGCELFMEVTDAHADSTNNCATWTFDGRTIQAMWDSGDLARLRVQKWDRNGVVVHRSSADGITAGLNALYVGHFRADGALEGEVTWSFPSGGMKGTWWATIDPKAASDTGRVGPPGVRLSGNWIDPAVPEERIQRHTYRVEQSGNTVQVFGIEGTRNGKLLADLHFLNAYTASGRLLENDAKGQSPATWTEDTVYFDDPDHFHITGKGWTFARVTINPDDVACDEANSTHVKREFAFGRARAVLGIPANEGIWNGTAVVDRNPDSASRDQDFRKAACWFHAAATQGHARAQAALASLYRDAHGVAGDPKAAFIWASKSAAQFENAGERLLSELFRAGVGTAADASKADYWLAWSQRPAPPTADERTRQARSMNALLGLIDAVDPPQQPGCTWHRTGDGSSGLTLCPPKRGDAQ